MRYAFELNNVKKHYGKVKALDGVTLKAEEGKIFGMLGLFYIFNGFHWAFNFELGVHDSALLTKYNCFLFIINIAVIAGMLIFGAAVNKKKLTHEFYIEKISEERQR